MQPLLVFILFTSYLTFSILSHMIVLLRSYRQYKNQALQILLKTLHYQLLMPTKRNLAHAQFFCIGFIDFFCVVYHKYLLA